MAFRHGVRIAAPLCECEVNSYRSRKRSLRPVNSNQNAQMTVQSPFCRMLRPDRTGTERTKLPLAVVRARLAPFQLTVRPCVKAGGKDEVAFSHHSRAHSFGCSEKIDSQPRPTCVASNSGTGTLLCGTEVPTTNATPSHATYRPANLPSRLSRSAFTASRWSSVW